MDNLTKRLMSEAARCMLAAVTARQRGDDADAEWNRLLACFLCGVAQDPEAVARLQVRRG
jgi:hypothetical protein